MAVAGKLALVLVLCVMVTNGAMTCPSVMSYLISCQSYLTGGGPVPTSCCNGVSSLYKAASTTVDRQTACKCLELTAKEMPSLDLDAAGSLPTKCGVDIPYKISPETDCSTVQ